MTEKNWSTFKTLFKGICISVALALISYWVYVFSLNEDLCVVDYKKWYQEENDAYPMLSMCFAAPFSKEKFRSSGTGINESTYLKYLKGEYFDSNMLAIDYRSITVDVDIGEYWVMWMNGSSSTIYPEGNDIKLLLSTYAGFWSWPNLFYNCYGIQIPNAKDVQVFAIVLKSDLFQSEKLTGGYSFITILHYPNQLLRSLKSFRNSWPKRKPNSTYIMRFKLTSAEVVRRRNKGTRPCTEDWKNYDSYVQMEHTKKAGCRNPYQNPIKGIQPCSNNEEMQKARFDLSMGNSETLLPPCKEMKNIHYSYEEQDLTGTEWDRSGSIWLGIYVFGQYFTEIVQTR